MRRVWWAAPAVAVAACTPTMRAMRQHPPALAGLWRDVERTTPSDTLYWRLSADGRLRPFHVRVVDGGTAVSDERLAPEHAVWYLAGRLDDPAHRALCVHGRAIARYCVSFVLDTLDGGGTRLRLTGYHGPFRVGPRTLVAAGG